MHQIVTANRLNDGLVVFRGCQGWSPDLGDAQIFPAADAEAVIARVKAEEATRVVGVYAVEVGPGKVPTKTRERIRALGPSVRPDLAKKGA